MSASRESDGGRADCEAIERTSGNAAKWGQAAARARHNSDIAICTILCLTDDSFNTVH